MPIITGQYTDPSMTVNGTMKPHRTVEYAVGRLRTDIATRVTENFQLDPKLEPTMLEAKIFPSSDVWHFDLYNAHLMFSCTYRLERQ